MMVQVDRLAGGILPFQKKRNVESRLPVFDNPENDNIKLDSKDSNVINVLQKEVWTKQRALKKSFDPVRLADVMSVGNINILWRCHAATGLAGCMQACVEASDEPCIHISALDVVGRDSGRLAANDGGNKADWFM